MIDWTCEACLHDPELKDRLGCEEPAAEPVWSDGEEVWYRCPLSFITEEITEWNEQRLYAQDFGNILPYEEQSSRWIAAWNVYRSALSKFAKLKQRSEGSESKTRDGLSALKAGFMARKRG